MKYIYVISILLLLLSSCKKDEFVEELETEVVEEIDYDIDISQYAFTKAFTKPVDSTAYPSDILRIVLYSDGAEPDILENGECFYTANRMGNALILAFTSDMHGDTINDGIYKFHDSYLIEDSESLFRFFQIRVGDPIIPGPIITGSQNKLNGEIEIYTKQNLKKLTFDITLGEYVIKGNWEGPISFCW